MNRTVDRDRFSFIATVPTAIEEREADRESLMDRHLASAFYQLTEWYAPELRAAMRRLSTQIVALRQPISILSVMRGGLPVGAVLTRLVRESGADVEHGLLGWIRGETFGLKPWGKHTSSATVVVVDGWTGSGDSMQEIVARWSGVPPPVTAALVDPANVCTFAGAHSDLICPHSIMQRLMSCGLGRVRRRSDGALFAPRTISDSCDFNSYCNEIYPSGVDGRDDPVNAASYTGAESPHSFNRDLLDRRLMRWGINECFRALARCELDKLFVSPSSIYDRAVRSLISLHGMAPTVRDIGNYACAGTVKSAA